ncbi:MAG: hypothetical protein OXG04_05270 [Acidobacteria bacterium]|nr:hypothetical protein [Acidobacteriota bacterium]
MPRGAGAQQMGDGATGGRRMTPPILTLPSPAETLWQAISETVREELRSISDGQAQYAIGGGSILAARWKHRDSYDIDLVVQPDAPLGMLAQANNPAAQFEARMRTLGGRPAFYPMARLWTVSFDKGERKLDLWATAPLLGAGRQACTIDGRLEAALSSAQILRGKLERAEEPLARDVFDIIKANEKEPEALEAAVNAISREAAVSIAQNYHWAAPTIAADSEKALRGIPDHERIEPRQLGHRAAHAIGNALYTTCRIRTRNGAIEVTTATNVRGEKAIRIQPNKAEHHFEATGLSAHLQPRGPGAKALLDYARTACRQQLDRVVFEAGADGVRAWRTAKAGMNLTPGNAADAEE